jgi:hypothetical protein
VSASAEGETIRVDVEPTGDAGASIADAVRRAIRSATSLTVEVDMVAPGDIVGSTPAGFVKVSRWNDERTTIRSSRDEQR